MTEKPTRLLSLDILRGFDLFILVAFCPLLLRIPYDAPWFAAIKTQFTHVSWDGFSAWDLVMPLFMFMSGVTIPFALARYRRPDSTRQDKVALYWRIAKRVVLLWIFGMLVQGNMLSLSPSDFKLFSNTLQAIAVGYLFSALIFLHFSKNVRYGIAVALLIVYWGVMTFCGDFTPQGNFAESIDRAVLGGFRDGATIGEDGSVQFAQWYPYTWIFTSLTFIVTVLTGLFAGEFLKNSTKEGSRKALTLALWGVAMVTAGWIWNLQMPVIKAIWTSSMVLVSSGYCFLLLALFYWVIDVKGWSKGLYWLRIYGMNSIVAYVLSETMIFTGLSRALLFGTKQYVGDFYPFVIELGNVAIVFTIIYLLYRNNKFLRV